MKIIELRFPLSGSTLRIDHGYALYGALSRLTPGLHQLSNIAIDLIEGVPVDNQHLTLTPHSTLKIRIPEPFLDLFLPLAGQRLELDGHLIDLAPPVFNEILPSPALYSRIVTIKGYTSPENFQEAIQRQLMSLGIHTALRIGPRRITCISNHHIVGFGVRLLKLENEDSLLLQKVGLGGRRKMGCGFFNHHFTIDG